MTNQTMLEKVKMQNLKPYTEMKNPYEVGDCEIVDETEKAIQIDFATGDSSRQSQYKRIWLPKSQCGFIIYENAWPTLCVEKWLVAQKRLW
jgi:hypothetical protein